MLLMDPFAAVHFQISDRFGKKRPYGDIGENAPSILRAYRDEIGAGGAVIVVRQADLFSLWQIHYGCFLSFCGKRSFTVSSFLLIFRSVREADTSTFHFSLFTFHFSHREPLPVHGEFNVLSGEVQAVDALRVVLVGGTGVLR